MNGLALLARWLTEMGDKTIKMVTVYETLLVAQLPRSKMVTKLDSLLQEVQKLDNKVREGGESWARRG